MKNKSALVGIDIDVGEHLRKSSFKGKNIDLLLSHHPSGSAFAKPLFGHADAVRHIEYLRRR
jgi:hypothetical protein